VNDEAAARTRLAALRRMRIRDVRIAVAIQLGRHERSQALLVQRQGLLELRTRVRSGLRAMRAEAAARRARER
jgi:hypothetical protein